MSGLAALYARDGAPVSRERIAEMLAVVPYRGLDGLFARVGGHVALGCARTFVTPEDAGGRQPLVSPRTGCAVVADARLDNRSELLRLLADGSAPIPGIPSDGELVLRAYERWGAEAAAHLLGDFAFIVWDPALQRMVCARDTSGTRSLYYRLDGATFAAASEITQLLSDPAVALAANEAQVRDYLVPLNVFRNEKDAPETFFRSIWQVPAGHTLVVTREAHTLTRYWELTPPAPIHYRTDAEYAEHFLALFTQVLRDRLRTSHPLGVLLSGGLDSSSVACLAQHLAQAGQVRLPGFTTFTAEYDGLACDERPYIEEMRDRYGFDARFISCGRYAGRLDLAPASVRETPNAGVREARDGIFGAAQQAGVRVLLTGDVADACLYGSRLVFDSLLRRGRLAELALHLRAFRRVSEDSLARVLGFYCALPLLPLPAQRRVVMAYLRYRAGRMRPYLLPDWVPAAARERLAARNLELALAAEAGRQFGNETLETERRMLYPPQTARSAAPWGVEIWQPYADRRLHEFLLAIPPEQKFRPHAETDEFYAGSKRVLRAAMHGILPESIRTRRSKTVFEPAWQREVEEQWPVYVEAFGPGARSRVAAAGYVDQTAFWERLQQFHADPAGEDALLLLRVVELETWLRGLESGQRHQTRVAGGDVVVEDLSGAADGVRAPTTSRAAASARF